MAVDENAVLDALRAVKDPDLDRDVVALGFVKDLRVEGADVAFTLELTTPACPVKDELKRQAHDAVAALEGVSSVAVELTAQVRSGGAHGGGGGQGNPLPQVKQVIAVGAGKGGVGKSTVAVNLALALHQAGAAVGLMDGDVYGPSIPKMLGVDARPRAVGPNRIAPNEALGLKVMSIGFLLDPSKPMVVRGPIVHSVVRQFLGDVEWGALDYLVVDLPPGTGDVALSLGQSVPVSGAVVVSTPQDVALIDVQKAVAMFRTLKIPVLGLVENMSWYECPKCGNRDELFGHAGAKTWAEREGIPFLGGVPIHRAVAVGGDEGRPALADERTPEAVREAFVHCAEELARHASIQALAPGRPLVQIEGLS